MSRQPALTRVFREIPGAPLRGFFLRGIPLKYVATPLSALGSKIGGGRYNAPGAFEVYYLAPDAEVALRETQAVDPDGAPRRIAPLTLFTVDVELQHVVDLTTGEVLRKLGVTAAELTAEWRAAILGGEVPITHQIGAAARSAGIEALIYPSVRVSNAGNLALIVDRLRRGSMLRINPREGFDPNTTVEITGSR